MKRIRLNDYDMAYVEVGDGPPLVLVHGSLGDYRVWSPVMGLLSRNHRVIAVSLRHFFPHRWPDQWSADANDGKFNIPQHVSDLIAFVEALDASPVDMIGHSRGGHIGFRFAQQRPDLLRKLVLAEPGGTLDETLAPPAKAAKPDSFARLYVQEASEKIRSGDINGGLRTFKDAIDGEGAWDSLSEADRQQRRDNAFTLLVQINEQRQPYSRADAQSIKVPTMFVGGADTVGLLPVVLQALSTHVPNAEVVQIPASTHVMFVQQPVLFCDAVSGFLGS